MRAACPVCPRCFSAIPEGDECPGCQLGFRRLEGVLDVIGKDARETRAAGVEAFYTQAPFPGYAPGDDGPVLLDRCRRVPFLVSLDEAIAPNATVLDAGCGTAQISNFLALAGPRRRVFGIDGCRESLLHAEGFRERSGVDNLQLVRGDLFDLPATEETFDVVISRGVVHHTPDPDRATAEVVKRVKPGGYLVLGWYETAGRLWHCTRRALGKLRGGEPFWALDPVLRRKDLDVEKKRIWIEDQYRHPLEYILSLEHVTGVLDGLGLRWLRSCPPAVTGNMFEATKRPGFVGTKMLRLGWALAGLNDPDAGLVCVVYQKPL
jgi:SAM-dependent methyltransferase